MVHTSWIEVLLSKIPAVAASLCSSLNMPSITFGHCPFKSFGQAILASADVLLGDRVALAAAKHGGASVRISGIRMQLLKVCLRLLKFLKHLTLD
jgi:hypothetical protein